MYLYFDKNGVLKEIINDESLRQGNYGVNTLYVYIESEMGADSVDVKYLLPESQSILVDPTNYEISETARQIPFDPKRDLRFFKYYKDYHFFEIPLAPVGDDEDQGDSPLDETGVVHCSLYFIANGAQLKAGEVNFMVEEDPVYNQHFVASEEYMSLANYQYLRYLIDRLILGELPDESITTRKLADACVTEPKIAQGAVTTDKIANRAVTSEKINSGAVTSEKLAGYSVGTDKIAAFAVTTGKISDEAIITRKIKYETKSLYDIRPQSFVDLLKILLQVLAEPNEYKIYYLKAQEGSAVDFSTIDYHYISSTGGLKIAFLGNSITIDDEQDFKAFMNNYGADIYIQQVANQ